MEEVVVEISPEEELLKKAIEPLLESEGFELVRIKLKKSQTKSSLAIFIDTKNQKNGVVLENLTDISRLLSDFLDVQFPEDNLLKGRYDLEVSSPGLDRPLSTCTHFKEARGERVKVRLKSAHVTGAKNIVGILREVWDDRVEIAPDHLKDETLDIPFQGMAEAHIVFDFSELDKHKKKTAKR